MSRKILVTSAPSYPMVKEVNGDGCPGRVKDVNFLDGTVTVEEGEDTPVKKKLFYRDLEKVK